MPKLKDAFKKANYRGQTFDSIDDLARAAIATFFWGTAWYTPSPLMHHYAAVKKETIDGKERYTLQSIAWFPECHYRGFGPQWLRNYDANMAVMFFPERDKRHFQYTPTAAAAKLGVIL